MFEVSPEVAGNGHTLTGFLLAVARVFIPSAWIFFHLPSNRPPGLAVTACAMCLAAAWMNRSGVWERRVALVDAQQGWK
jgi:hypothetical protein